MYSTFLIIVLCLPDPESTLFCNPGKENDIKIRLEDLEKRAPSPLSFTFIGTSDAIVDKALDFCEKNYGKTSNNNIIAILVGLLASFEISFFRLSKNGRNAPG